MTKTNELPDVSTYAPDIDAHGNVEGIVPYVPPTLFGGADPTHIAEQAAAKAKVLKDVVTANGLAKKLGRDGHEHIQLEGWTFLGSMFGVFGVTSWTRPLVDDAGARYGWEARAEALTLDGRVVGAAEAMCSRHENNWKSRDEYALRSMAQTRAVSKALRMPLSFVVVLAGYEATPSDEIPEAGETTAADLPEGRPPGSRPVSPTSEAEGSWKNLASEVPAAGGPPQSWGEGGSPAAASSEEWTHAYRVGLTTATVLRELQEAGIKVTKKSQVTSEQLADVVKAASGKGGIG